MAPAIRTDNSTGATLIDVLSSLGLVARASQLGLHSKQDEWELTRGQWAYQDVMVEYAGSLRQYIISTRLNRQAPCHIVKGCKRQQIRERGAKPQ
jgi:hypothetical protein